MTDKCTHGPGVFLPFIKTQLCGIIQALILNIVFNKTMASFYPTSSGSGSSSTGLIKTLISPNKSLMETLFGPDYLMWIIIIVFGTIIIFLILREVRTWYWKINDQITLLKKIEENTRPKELVHEPLEKSDKSI